MSRSGSALPRSPRQPGRRVDKARTSIADPTAAATRLRTAAVAHFRLVHTGDVATEPSIGISRKRNAIVNLGKHLLRKRAGKRLAVRATVVAAVIIGALVTPTTAGAHSRGRAVALDFRLSLIGSGETVPGVQAEVIDGNREMRFTVDPGRRVIVPGLLGEPMLRFSRSGVWVNRRSPTAAADGLVPPAASGAPWTRRAVAIATGGTIIDSRHRRIYNPARGWPGRCRSRLTADPRRYAVGTSGQHSHAGGRGSPQPSSPGGLLRIIVQRVPNRRGRVAAVIATLSTIAAIVSGVAFAVP